MPGSDFEPDLNGRSASWVVFVIIIGRRVMADFHGLIAFSWGKQWSRSLLLRVYVYFFLPRCRCCSGIGHLGRGVGVIFARGTWLLGHFLRLTHACVTLIDLV